MGGPERQDKSTYKSKLGKKGGRLNGLRAERQGVGAGEARPSQQKVAIQYKSKQTGKKTGLQKHSCRL